MDNEASVKKGGGGRAGASVPAKKLRMWAFSAAASVVACVVYALTFADYVFPGESAQLFTQWVGMDALDLPLHPIWGWFVKAFAGVSASVVGINLLSLVCGVVSAGLVCWLVGEFVFQSIYHEDSRRFNVGAARAAGIVAAFAFIFSTAAWQSSTHLDYRMFDMAMALVAFMAFVPLLRWPKLVPAGSFVIGLGVAAGLVEGATFMALAPLYMAAVALTAIKTGRKFYVPTTLFLVATLGGYFLFTRMTGSAYLALPEAAAGGMEDVGDVWQKCVAHSLREMRAWFGRSGWLYVTVLSVLPFIACLFAAGRGLNNDRKWSQYLFHFAMTVCAILATVTPLAPAAVMRRFGVSPVATSTLAAMTCGYLAAYWYVLARTPLPRAEAGGRLPAVIVAGRRIAPVAGVLLVVLLALASLVNAFDCTKGRGRFADVCAGEIVDRMGDRTWLVTDGLLDEHLRVAAAARGKELNLICMHRDMDEAYLKELAALVREKGLKAGTANLDISIQLGVLPFLEDWFGGDPDVAKKAAVFGLADFWFMANCQPMPECLFFGGAPDIKSVDGKKAKADFLAFWKKISPYLPPNGKKGSMSIADVDDMVAKLRLQLRRHVGFIANNLGVALQDMGLDADAFEIYELVLKDIDRDNICALFNEFEMARANFPAAVARKAELEAEIKAIVDDKSRRYVLSALSRYYGYIRSPEIFARMGFGWARSAQTGNAIAQIRRAADLVPVDRQSGLLNMLASVYASGNDMKKSREVYKKVLDGDSTNHDALVGMARLSMQSGEMSDARGYLEKAAKSTKDKERQGFDWAMLHIIDNNLPAARLALQKVTDVQTKSTQAWFLMAGVLFQQHDSAKDAAGRKKALSEIEKSILPKLEQAANSPNDYFVQMTRAFLWMRKGPEFRVQARDALVAAFSVRSDVNSVGEMILEMDVSMNDPESAEKHARQVLRVDRTNRMANYVMGSLRLQAGEFHNAETFLRIAADAEKPLPAAQNDLAETLRRQDKFEEAEKYARAAIKTAPKLYVAWETLASILLDRKTGLDEAEKCVKEALRLSKEENKIDDVRMQITLARVQIARRDFGHARVTLREIRKRSKDLSAYELGEVDKLQKSVRGDK